MLEIVILIGLFYIVGNYSVKLWIRGVFCCMFVFIIKQSSFQTTFNYFGCFLYFCIMLELWNIATLLCLLLYWTAISILVVHLLLQTHFHYLPESVAIVLIGLYCRHRVSHFLVNMWIIRTLILYVNCQVCIAYKSSVVALHLLLAFIDVLLLLVKVSAPCGLRVFFVRIDPVCFLAGCRKRRLNQG